LVPLYSSSKNEKSDLILAGDVFSIGSCFRAYPPFGGYSVHNYCDKLMEMNM